MVGWDKVSCILPHWAVQLILAYSWATCLLYLQQVRVCVWVGEGGGGDFFYFFTFIHFPLSYLSLSFISSTISSSSLPSFSGRLWDDAKWPTRVDVSLNPNTNKQTNILSKLSTRRSPGRQFAWTIEAYYLEKKKKIWICWICPEFENAAVSFWFTQPSPIMWRNLTNIFDCSTYFYLVCNDARKWRYAIFHKGNNKWHEVS